MKTYEHRIHIKATSHLMGFIFFVNTKLKR